MEAKGSREADVRPRHHVRAARRRPPGIRRGGRRRVLGRRSIASPSFGAGGSWARSTTQRTGTSGRCTRRATRSCACSREQSTWSSTSRVGSGSSSSGRARRASSRGGACGTGRSSGSPATPCTSRGAWARSTDRVYLAAWKHWRSHEVISTQRCRHWRIPPGDRSSTCWRTGPRRLPGSRPPRPRRAHRR